MAHRGCTSTSADVRRAGLSLVVALALAALSSCGGGSSSEDDASKESKKTETTIQTGITADDPGCRFIVAGTGSRSTIPGTTVEYMTSAVAEPFACYDKVTFTFDAGDAPVEDTPPAYTVEYRKAPFGLLKADGKAISTSTAGFKEAKAVLYVEMTPASTTDRRSPPKLRDCPPSTYCGNLRLLLKDMHHVVIAEWIQKLPEATATAVTTTTIAGAVATPERVVWLIGLDSKRPFTVDFARDPVPHINVLIMK